MRLGGPKRRGDLIRAPLPVTRTHTQAEGCANVYKGAKRQRINTKKKDNKHHAGPNAPPEALLTGHDSFPDGAALNWGFSCGERSTMPTHPGRDPAGTHGSSAGTAGMRQTDKREESKSARPTKWELTACSSHGWSLYERAVLECEPGKNFSLAGEKRASRPGQQQWELTACSSHGWSLYERAVLECEPAFFGSSRPNVNKRPN